MTYDLFIGDKGFSSWSLRSWLLFKKFDIDVNVHLIELFTGTMKHKMADLAPARLVPTVRTPEGWIIGESIAIVETLAERHPSLGIWPQDTEARLYARWLVAEMHVGFSTLRNDCPMQLFKQIQNFEISNALSADIARLEDLLSRAFDRFACDGDYAGGWLFGAYSAADAFYAPVAARLAGYDLPISDRLSAYVWTHLKDPAFKSWRADGIAITYDPFPCDLGENAKPWPEAD